MFYLHTQTTGFKMNTQTDFIETDEIKTTVFFQENKETLESCINAALNIYDQDQVTVIVPRETSNDYFAILPTKNILVIPHWSGEHAERFSTFVDGLNEVPSDVANDGYVAIGKHQMQVLNFKDILEYRIKKSWDAMQVIVEKYK